MDSTVSSVTQSIMEQENSSLNDATITSSTLPVTIGGGSGFLGSSTCLTVGQTSKRFQKLYETFSESRLGEKLRFHGNPGVGSKSRPQSQSASKQQQIPTFSVNNCSTISPSKRRVRSDKIKPINESTIDEESSEDFESSVDQKDSGVDPGDTEEHVIVPIPLKYPRHSNTKKYSSSSSGTEHNCRYVLEVDEDLISAGFPSDLPSGLIDIEGNFIGEFDFRFGLDDDDYESVDCDETFHGVNIKHGKTEKKAPSNDLIKKSSSDPKKTEMKDCKGANSNRDAPIHRNISKSLDMAETNGRLENVYCNSTSQTSNSNSVPEEEDGNSRVKEEKVQSPQRTFVHRRRSRSPHAPLDRHYSSGATSSNSTISIHYYPEFSVGWGVLVLMAATSCHSFLCGMQLSFGILMRPISNKFGEELVSPSGWLGALSLGISLFLSPVWVSICKRKSTRLSAVFGGLVAALGCLFTSFASQFHQLFVSYGAFIGVGVGLTRDASTLMVGQYFKRKRDMVEIVVVAGSGLGIILMSVSIHSAITSLGWRLGLQAITVSLFLTFFLSTCYRSASLYHPQRRAILHLKNQKRKVKEKEKQETPPPFIDYSCLRSKTLQILLLSSAFIAFGLYNPLFSLAVECSRKGLEGCSLVLLNVYVGAGWIIGCLFFGLLVIQKSPDCRVSKQYLAQVASVICGMSILTLTSVKGNSGSGLVVFSWVYGFSLGGYNYALKVYTYERVRARHFPRAWSFVQWSQSLPLIFGVPITAELNQSMGWKYGYLLSAISIFIGSACLFLADVRRRKISRRKANSQNSSMKTCETTDGTQSPKSKRLSFSFPVPEQPQPVSKHDSDDEDDPGGGGDPSVMIKELTCISEEGIADMDYQDIYFDEWAEYFGECITSCNKVENCLASEYDPDYAVLVERRARRWSAARQNTSSSPGGTMLNIPLVGGKKGKGKTTVLGVPKLFQLNLGHRSQQSSSSHQNSQQSQSQLESSGSENASVSTSGVVRAVPFMRSQFEKGGGGSRRINRDVESEHSSSFGAIDEDSV